MKCHNCSKPVMFMIGDSKKGIPLCLDCNAKFQEVMDRQQERNELLLNYYADQIEYTVGLPGIIPRVPLRRPRTVIQQGGLMMNNIRIDRSNIGVVNTGFIGSVDTAVGVMKSSGDAEAAQAFQEFTERVVANADADAALKNKVIELLSVLASEATAPKDRRRGTAMRALLTELSTICSGVASLVQLYHQYSPVVEGLFK